MNALSGTEMGGADSRLVLRQGGVALFIKILAAALSFLMFLSVSHALPKEGFGQFGFAFSLVTFLALAGSLGQRSSVLRFAGSYQSDPDTARQLSVVRFGYGVVLSGCLLAALILATVAMLWREAPAYLWPAAAFVIVLGLAEYQAHALRSFHSIALALLPRDVLWRAGVIVLALVSARTDGIMGTVTGSLWGCTGVLLLLVFSQAAVSPQLRSALRGPWFDSPPFEREQWRGASIGLWGTSLVTAAGANLSVIILGVMVSPSAVGPLFAALKTSMLLSLFLMAANMIAAPLIARHYANQNFADLQRLLRFVAALVALPTLAVFMAVLAAGDSVLALFGPGFSGAHLELVLLSAGFLCSAAAGPNALLLEMAGAERLYLRGLSVTTAGSLLCLPMLIEIFGATGAAAGISLGVLVGNVWASRICIQQLGLNPALLPSRMLVPTMPKARVHK